MTHVEDYKKDGFAVLKGFATAEECEEMKSRMAELLDKWDPNESKESVFDVSREAHLNSEYFFNSSDKIRFFLEPQATDAGVLKDGFAKHLAVHKVGHALHFLDPVFAKYSTSEKVRNLIKELGYKDPVLPQSMYIFKQPEIGDAAVIHQDSTFLHTTPRTTCLGLWLALHDATEENGCLWGKKGSQSQPVRKVFVRNPEYFNGDKTKPAILFEECEGVAQQDTDGKRVETAEEARALGYTPLPVKAGDLVLIHGEADHLSFSNTSPNPRHSYQLHLVEGPGNGITWSPRNWLQYPDNGPFPSLKAP